MDLCVYGYVNVLGGVLAVYLFPKGCSPLSPKVLSMERGMVPPGLWGLGTVGMGWQVWSAAGKNTMLSWGICSVLAHPAWRSRVIRVTSLSCCRCVPGCSAAVTPKTGVRLGVGCSEDLKSSPSSRFLATAPFWYKSRGHKAKKLSFVQSAQCNLYFYQPSANSNPMPRCFGKRLIGAGFCSYYLFIILANKIQSSGFSLTVEVHRAAWLMISLDNFW